MGGTLGETNSVSFMFDRVGVVRYPGATASEDDVLEAAIEAGADNVESDETAHEITCAPDQLNTVRDALEARFGAPESAKLGWKPQTQIAVSDEPAEKLFKLLEALDDNDDVQTVIANYEVSEETLARLTA
jgi:transcriptional/translational regulatory protein YebC/TACO1